jgi:hypothetical protein
MESAIPTEVLNSPIYNVDVEPPTFATYWTDPIYIDKNVPQLNKTIAMILALDYWKCDLIDYTYLAVLHPKDMSKLFQEFDTENKFIKK